MEKEEQDKIDKEIFGELRDDLIEILKSQSPCGVEGYNQAKVTVPTQDPQS